ncbi:MAG: signal peptide peptidase SppA [Candidatus Sumerlaeia bacterium]
MIVLILFISFVTLLSGALNHMPGLSAIGESVALLEVEGPILDTRRHLEFVQQFEQKSNWKAMVIRIESPGGASAVTQELFSEIQRVKNETGKPVIVSMGNTAASGGYYLALAGDKLYATPSTITGSVGVILSIPNLEELFDKIGYQPRTVKSGEFKDLGDVGREWTPREKALLQGLIDNVFTQFFNDVVTQRRAAIMQALQSEPALREEFPDLNDVLSDDSPTTDPVRWFARQICDGRVITGEQALRYGFVDALGGLPDALREAERRAGLKHPANVISSKKAPTLMDLLSGNVRSMLDALGPRHPTLQFRWTLP